MFDAKLVDLLDLFPLGIAADGEHLESTFQREHNGFRQTGVDDVLRQTDGLQTLDRGWQFDFAGFDHQHIGTLGHLLGREIQRTRDIGNDATRLDFGDVQNFLAGPRGGRHDHVHFTEQAVVISRCSDFGVRRVLQNRIPQFIELLDIATGDDYFIEGHGQQSRADRPDGACGADHHGLGWNFLGPLLHRNQPHAPHRVGRRPQGARCGVAVASGDRNSRPSRHRNARIADDLGEGAQAHQLGPHGFRNLCGMQQTPVGEFGAVRQHFLGRAAHRNQPAFGFSAGRRDDVAHLAIHHRRQVGGERLHSVHDELGRGLGKRVALLDVLLAERMHDKGKTTDVAEMPGGVKQARLDVELVDDLLEIVIGEFRLRLSRGGKDHGGDGADADDPVKEFRRNIHHQIDFVLGEKCQRFVIDGRGDQGLSFQIAAGGNRLDFPEGADDYVGLGHGIGDDLVLHGPQHGFQEISGHDVGNQFLTLGVKLKLLQRTQQERGARLEDRIGKAEVPGVIGQGDRHVVVAHSG